MHTPFHPIRVTGMRLIAVGVAAYKNPVPQLLPSWYLIRHVVMWFRYCGFWHESRTDVG